MPADQLHHVDSEDTMKWRRVGDASVPTESEAEEGRDDTVTLHELKEDGDDLERSALHCLSRPICRRNQKAFTCSCR